ncbi:hypothetical protein [Lentzea sp. NPDC003310]|uniref:hypothetical protein n=1 Tax=Lentzea sp. NPDC003310 TaxID=3154447 RepID=UPI0033A24013
MLEPFSDDEDFDRDDCDEWPVPATGSKIGGWTNWWHTGTSARPCAECGAPWRQALAPATKEQPPGQAAGWLLGDHGALNVFLCSRDALHPVRIVVD